MGAAQQTARELSAHGELRYVVREANVDQRLCDCALHIALLSTRAQALSGRL